MKFTTNFKFIAIIALITLSCISAAKISAKNKDGSGNWDNGFTCPKILVNNKNQGEATIYAKLITGQSGDNVYSMLFQFKSAPAADFKKIARDAGSNKWRVSYRRMGNDFIYVNPWGNKYIEGTVADEAGKKIKNAMNTSATKRSQNVSYQKQLLRKQFPNYVSVKGQFDAISKNKADYEAFVEKQKKELEKLKGQIDGLRTSAADAQKSVDSANLELLAANSSLEELLRQESALGSKKLLL